MTRALDIYVDSGRFAIAAKAEKDIAEIYEAEGNLTEVRRRAVGAIFASDGFLRAINVANAVWRASFHAG